MKVYIITRADLFAGEHERYEQLVRAGAERIHLRKPELSDEQIETFIQKLSSAARAVTVLHSRGAFERDCVLCERYALAGVHLPERVWRKSQEALSSARSISVHSCNDVEAHLATTHYLFISPLFETSSKPLSTPLQCEAVIALSKKYPDKVVPLGGITRERARTLSAAGVSSCAVLSAVWDSNEPVHAYREFVAA